MFDNGSIYKNGGNMSTWLNDEGENPRTENRKVTFCILVIIFIITLLFGYYLKSPKNPNKHTKEIPHLSCVFQLTPYHIYGILKKT